MPQTQRQADVRGLICPDPLKIVRNMIREMNTGDSVKVLATDPTTKRDFRNFCHFMGHELVSEKERDQVFEYVIRKG